MTAEIKAFGGMEIKFDEYPIDKLGDINSKFELDGEVQIFSNSFLPFPLYRKMEAIMRITPGLAKSVPPGGTMLLSCDEPQVRKLFKCYYRRRSGVDEVTLFLRELP